MYKVGGVGLGKVGTPIWVSMGIWVHGYTYMVVWVYVRSLLAAVELRGKKKKTRKDERIYQVEELEQRRC